MVLNPEHSAILHGAGLTREDIAQELYERSFVEASIVKRLFSQFAGPNPQDRMAFKGPEQILILQAGGSGVYSMVMPSWCVGRTRQLSGKRQGQADMFCEIPGLAG